MVDSMRPSAPVVHADPAEHRRQIATVVNLINQSTPDYRRTPAETTAGVTPVDHRYPAGNVFRFMTAAQQADVVARTALVDVSTAISSAYSSVPTGGALELPAGIYRCTSALTFSAKQMTMRGAGSRQTVLLYDGADTTNDCFTFGDGTNNVNGLRLEGIEFQSNTTMTAGTGVRFRRLQRSVLRDVLFGHQDGNLNFYNGVWFDEVDVVSVQAFQARGQQDALRVSGGTGGEAGLYLNDGKISKSVVGLHVGGGFGGVYVDGTDIINNGTNVLIDKDIVATANREVFLGPGCTVDTADTTQTATTFDGIGIDIQDTGGFVMLRGTWIASAGTLIRCGSSFAGSLHLDGGLLLNAFTADGGNGYGIELAGTSTQLEVNGTHFRNIDGTGIICSNASAANVFLKSPRFFTDVVEVLSNVNFFGSYLDVTKYVTRGGGAPVRVNKNGTDQTGIVTATTTKVSFSNTVFDVESAYDDVNDRITPTARGQYLAHAAIAFKASVDQSFLELAIFKNGSKVARSLQRSSGTGSQSLDVSMVLDLDVTDYLEVKCQQNTGANQDIDGAAELTYFEVHRIS